MSDLPKTFEQRLPDGQAINCQHLPVLTPAHTNRLRKIFAHGREVHLGTLSGIELDLIVHGLLESLMNRVYAGATVIPTKLGVAHISDARQTLIQAQRAHHELGHRLALHLRAQGFFTWENVEFSNPAQTNRTWGVVRPDVFACFPSLKAKNATPAIYEVKVSRADFLADVAKPEKRMAYGELAEAVYFVCADSLIDKAEVPEGCGLLCETGPGVFVLKKRAKRKKNFILATDTAMALMVKRQSPISDEH